MKTVNKEWAYQMSGSRGVFKGRAFVKTGKILRVYDPFILEFNPGISFSDLKKMKTFSWEYLQFCIITDIKLEKQAKEEKYWDKLIQDMI